MTHPRVKFVSQEIRGGVLRRSGDPEPNVHDERAYTIRVDRDHETYAPLDMAVWLSVLLTPAERVQWADTLLEGL